MTKESIIGTFNIKEFGEKKFNNDDVMKIIVKILKRYDIVLCQEVHLSEELIKQLVDKVSTSSIPYSYVSSQPIGRSLYKERYLYLYRSNKWNVLENYAIEKFCNKISRVPYVVQFQNLKKTYIRITLVGCHTHPDNAYDEIKALVNNIYKDIKAKLEKKDRFSFLFNVFYCFGGSCISSNNNEPIIIMGDFNASGSYLNKTKQTKLDKILKNNDLMWGIGHSSDTTVASKCNAYNRFVFEIKNKERWIGNTRIFKFDKKLNKKLSTSVSDHYPIEFELKLDIA
ncbi:14059_t:CDS:1 [Dentiscutata heterogama]|uniref:14059_t:CDS:1 n=1 Tax=Dentiscutata heterogama TaxID=1316150 RepID=A0ACA9L9U7_9GLOM|nr:14059_t:CDS:1 [Dentiscutata heterogama]